MAENCCGSSCSCGCDEVRENKLCELTKPHNRFNIEKIMPLVDKPRYLCRCCGRLANQAESLCNPIKLTE